LGLDLKSPGPHTDSMRTLIVNFKNYKEVYGDGSTRLAAACAEVSKGSGVRIIVAPPVPLLSQVASSSGIPVYSQSVDDNFEEKSTGALVPGMVKGAGCAGTILNHSESRMGHDRLAKLVPMLAGIGLEVCLCAGTAAEAAELAALRPTYLAVEPPELIGSGMAVSRTRPGLITDTVNAVRGTGYGGPVLCGAGIVDGPDVKKAVELGTEGVLVSSSVVKARDWKSKVEELARSLV
jgi:triosephosphate isomerase (TIM)